MNVRLGKAKFNSIRIMLDYGSISSIILGKHKKNHEIK